MGMLKKTIMEKRTRKVSKEGAVGGSPATQAKEGEKRIAGIYQGGSALKRRKGYLFSNGRFFPSKGRNRTSQNEEERLGDIN